MIYIIFNKENTKLVSSKVFKNKEEAIKYKKERIKFWNKFCKKNGNVPIYTIWKNSQIITINWKENVFSDTDIVNLQEQNRRKTYSLNKECKIADSQMMSDKVDNYLNKRMRLCYAG